MKSYESLSCEGYELELKGLYLAELTCRVKSHDSLSCEGYGLELKGQYLAKLTRGV